MSSRLNGCKEASLVGLNLCKAKHQPHSNCSARKFGCDWDPLARDARAAVLHNACEHSCLLVPRARRNAAHIKGRAAFPPASHKAPAGGHFPGPFAAQKLPWAPDMRSWDPAIPPWLWFSTGWEPHSVIGNNSINFPGSWRGAASPSLVWDTLRCHLPGTFGQGACRKALTHTGRKPFLT